MNQTTTATDTEPVAPASIPEYVREGVEARDPATLRELAAWATDLAEYRESRPIAVDDDEELVSVEEDGDDATTGTKVVKKIPCGKDCEGCPHGPYEYRVHREGKALNWEYIGPVGDA